MLRVDRLRDADEVYLLLSSNLANRPSFDPFDSKEDLSREDCVVDCVVYVPLEGDPVFLLKEDRSLKDSVDSGDPPLFFPKEDRSREDDRGCASESPRWPFKSW
jgi:hypothetical protein